MKNQWVVDCAKIPLLPLAKRQIVKNLNALSEKVRVLQMLPAVAKATPAGNPPRSLLAVNTEGDKDDHTSNDDSSYV